MQSMPDYSFSLIIDLTQNQGVIISKCMAYSHSGYYV